MKRSAARVREKPALERGREKVLIARHERDGDGGSMKKRLRLPVLFSGVNGATLTVLLPDFPCQRKSGYGTGAAVAVTVFVAAWIRTSVQEPGLATSLVAVTDT